MGRGRAIEDEHLEPPGRGDLVVRRRDQSTRVAVARELGEERACVHGVAVGGRRRCEEFFSARIDVFETKSMTYLR